MSANLPKGKIIYNGKVTAIEHFRTFVYSLNDKKLAKSYDEYKALIASGLWFDSAEAAEKGKPAEIVKPARASRKPLSKPATVLEPEIGEAAKEIPAEQVDEEKVIDVGHD